jgi:hypothetical protein
MTATRAHWCQGWNKTSAAGIRSGDQLCSLERPSIATDLGGADRLSGRFVRWLPLPSLSHELCGATLTVTGKSQFIVRAVRSRKLTSQMVSRAPKGRSKVTNGRQLFIDGDARLKVSRRFRDVLARLSEGRRGPAADQRGERETRALGTWSMRRFKQVRATASYAHCAAAISTEAR